MSSPHRHVSGLQYVLRAGDYHADVASVGATLRTLCHRGRHLVASFAPDEMRPAMRGALMAPWPNRTADGRYEWDGVRHQLAIDEMSTRTALHGLVAWMQFEPSRVAEDAVALTATVEPQPGYPWRVRVDVTFSLGEEGLRQEVVATNLSETAAPCGIGAHPYLLAGASAARAADDWLIDVPATQVPLSSEDRLLPVGLVRVDEYDHGVLDFRVPRRVGTTALNHAFTSLRRDRAGETAIRVVDAEGRGAQVVVDQRCPWVQLYTADHAVGDEYRSAIAVEPMTCPPDALNSTIDLLIIPPGGSAEAGWRIEALEP